MKNGKRPTKAQKKILAFYGFHPEDWLISKNTSTELVILHRYTERTRHIPKHRDTETICPYERNLSSRLMQPRTVTSP